MTQILLKARPTIDQLHDRVLAPRPDGIELYLDRLDLAGIGWRPRIRAAVERTVGIVPFTWIVEAPIRTLEDRYFDLTKDDEDHRETLRRVLAVGLDLGAVAANVHVVAPTLDGAGLSELERQRALDKAVNLLAFYVKCCGELGMIPQVENIPPVGRMRENAYVYSAIGAAPRDLLFLAQTMPELRFTVDVSHAALYLNWRKADERNVDAAFRRVVAFHHEVDDPTDLVDYVRRVMSKTVTVHVSNANGLLGEGLGYLDGDEQLDLALFPLVGIVPYFVTETLEADPDHARGMRDAQTRLRQLRSSAQGAAV